MFLSSLTGVKVWKGRGDSLALPVSRGVEAELAAASVVQFTLVLVLAQPPGAVQQEARVAGALETAGHIQTPPALTGARLALQTVRRGLTISSSSVSLSSHLVYIFTLPLSQHKARVTLIGNNAM